MEHEKKKKSSNQKVVRLKLKLMFTLGWPSKENSHAISRSKSNKQQIKNKLIGMVYLFFYLINLFV